MVGRLFGVVWCRERVGVGDMGLGLVDGMEDLEISSSFVVSGMSKDDFMGGNGKQVMRDKMDRATNEQVCLWEGGSCGERRFVLLSVCRWWKMVVGV